MSYTNLYSVPGSSNRTLLVLGYNSGTEYPYSMELGNEDAYLGNIVLGQSGVRLPTTLNKSANQSLTFSQVVVASVVHFANVNQTLTFTQEVKGGKVIDLEIEDSLIFVDGAARVIDLEVEQSLTFTDSGESERLIPRTVSHTISFSQDVDPSMVYTRTISQSLTLSENIVKQRTSQQNITQTLTFTDVAKRIIDRSVSQSLTFTQETAAARDRALFVTQRFEFTQSASRLMSYARSVSDQLVFTEAKLYTPIGQITVPFATYSIANRKETFLILESKDELVVLPTPEFGDTDKPERTVQVKRSMNNTVYSFIKRNTLRTLHYEFEMGRKKAVELQRFIRRTVGDRVWLKNWKGEVWYGNIISNPIEYTMLSRYELEREKVGVTLEFSGIKLN